ncbi:hypothetical protein [Streptomyces sp. SID12501]|uniref:Uncharacterized protein n=1 Tax=Streptomyces sp. SID12501 TaxID=2706042 RepID=A0A6B3C681_9ACTN|nr:hypothetical protein [Streptomyces sp. SID12501]NEC92315.1 hypothetical protein [Streptomyces sp. SID12501]
MTHEPEAAPWFIEHLREYTESDSGPEMEQLGRSMRLLRFAVFAQTEYPYATTFPNDMAAGACMAQAFEQLEAATVMLSYGFYGVVRNILRSVYESAGLGRTLAKEVAMAEKWLRKNQWWPDSVVRQWLEDNRVVSVEKVQLYRNYYREASAWTHPTATSCMGQFTPTDTALVLTPGTIFDAERSRLMTAEITSTAVFVCFALRNSVVDEEAIDPGWRRDLYELAREQSGEALPHLDRDWTTEQETYDTVMSRLQDVSVLEEVLNNHPHSWRNLKKNAVPDTSATRWWPRFCRSWRRRGRA